MNYASEHSWDHPVSYVGLDRKRPRFTGNKQTDEYHIQTFNFIYNNRKLPEKHDSNVTFIPCTLDLLEHCC